MRGAVVELIAKAGRQLLQFYARADAALVYQMIAHESAVEGERVGIPTFTAKGYLPPGRYRCDLLEFQQRYALNPRRKQLFDGLLTLIGDLESCGCRRVVIGGSYVTSKNEPGDFEGLFDAEGVDMTALANRQPALLSDSPEHQRMQASLYGGALCPWYHHPRGDTGLFEYFQYDDRNGCRKGVVVIEF